MKKKEKKSNSNNLLNLVHSLKLDISLLKCAMANCDLTYKDTNFTKRLPRLGK